MPVQRPSSTPKQELRIGDAHEPGGQIRGFFAVLNAAWGPQRWWPAETPLEVIVGAYLTQNTAWSNVEKAIARLKSVGILHLDGLRNIRTQRLEQLIRSSGYFRQKAKRLKTFVRFLDAHYGGSLDRMFATPTSLLREQLLSLNGVGPETADSILLYAGNHAVFVVDAYTRRILERHGLANPKTTYEEVCQLFESSLQPEFIALHGVRPTKAPGSNAYPPSAMSAVRREPLVRSYNEMHALMVGVAKNYCRKSEPRCEQCPLQRFLPAQARPTPSPL